MPNDTAAPSTERQRLAAWIRGARLHAPKRMSDDFYDCWDAGLRRLVAETLLEGAELASFDMLPPSKVEMNRKPRVR